MIYFVLPSVQPTVLKICKQVARLLNLFKLSLFLFVLFVCYQFLVNKRFIHIVLKCHRVSQPLSHTSGE